MKLKHFVLGLILMVMINQFFWLSTIPYNQAPDEWSHFWVSRFILEKGYYPKYLKDPVDGILKEGDRVTPAFNGMPPLAYLTQAGFLIFFNQLVSPGNYYLLGRLSQLIFTPFLLIGAYLLAKAWFKKSGLVKIFCLMVGFWPSLTFLSSYINSDWAAVCLTSFFIGLASYFQSRPVNFKTAGWLGLSLGAALLSRYNAFIVLLLTTIYLIYRWLNQKNWLAILGFSLSSGLSGGWWYIHNWLKYHDLLLVRPFYQAISLVRPEEVRNYSLAQFFQSGWFQTSFKSLVFSFDWNYRFWPAVFYGLILVIAIAVSLTNLIKSKARFYCWSFIAVSALWLQAAWHSWRLSFQPQGRHLLPGILLILSLGFFSLQAWLSLSLALLVFSLNVYSLVFQIIPTYLVLPRSGVYPVLDYFNQLQFNRPLIFNRFWLMTYLLIFVILGSGLFLDLIKVLKHD